MNLLLNVRESNIEGSNFSLEETQQIFTLNRVFSIVYFLIIKILKMKKNILIIGLICLYCQAYTQQLIPQFNKTVTFLYVLQDGVYKPYGTGFLVSIPAKNNQGNYVYLVTAKHVLQEPNHTGLNNIFARFNTKDSSQQFYIPLIWSGPKKTVYTHSDESIDLSIIQITPPQNLNYISIPIDLIAKRSEYDSLKINVGTDVFFTGLFTGYTGTKTINPITRFGKLCLIPKELIEFDNFKRELLLMESMTFGGNSGSPVLFQYTNGITTSVKLAGIVLGSFNQTLSNNKNDLIAMSNIGISAITPAEFILDILNNSELAKLRIE
jgi:hypothetical protein